MAAIYRTTAVGVVVAVQEWGEDGLTGEAHARACLLERDALGCRCSELELPTHRGMVRRTRGGGCFAAAAVPKPWHCKSRKRRMVTKKTMGKMRRKKKTVSGCVGSSDFSLS
uniref:Uncharacterized protein n=1 Tax=Oryza brachyantha TaxID=4533 RepID=J3LHX0_ORYBR